MEHQKFQKTGEVIMNKRVFSYDLIRFIGMAMVVLYHMNCELYVHNISSPLIVSRFGENLEIGQLGVSIFLILSGASQCISYSKSKDLKQYYAKRWLSVFPAFYIAYILGYMICILPAGVTGNYGRLIWTILGMDGYLSLSGVQTSYIVGEWFLGLIILLYLVFPLVYELIRRFPGRYFVIFCIYFAVMSVLYPFNRAQDSNVLLRIADFSAGIYLFMYVKRIKGWQALAALVIQIVFFFVKIDVPGIFTIEVQGISAFVLLFYIGEKVGRCHVRIVEGVKKAISMIAGCSYEVFLIHHVLISVALNARGGTDFGRKGYLMWAGYMLVMIFLGTLIVHICSEHIVRRVKDVLEMHRSNSDAEEQTRAR